MLSWNCLFHMCITSYLSGLHFICCFTAVTFHGNILLPFIIVSPCFYYLEKLGVISKFCLLTHTHFFSTNENVVQPRQVWLYWWPPSPLKRNLLFLSSLSWLTWLCLETTIPPFIFQLFPLPHFHSFSKISSTSPYNIRHWCPDAFYNKTDNS